jgi:hypothetical protein
MRSLKGVHLAATFPFSTAILFVGRSGGKVSSGSLYRAGGIVRMRGTAPAAATNPSNILYTTVQEKRV